MNDDNFKNSKILLVEDEETLALGLEFNLKDEGYLVDWAKDGKQGLELWQKKEYDLIILDIMLPYYDGFEIAEKIRKKSPQVPILFLTAKISSADKIRGLELGADDYITKPFHLKELLLRIKRLLKRKMWYKSSAETQSDYQFGSNKINFLNLNCSAGNKKFTLTAMEAMVLRYLIDNKEKVVTRKDLLENVWHISSDVETRTVDIFISRLRKYFEPDPDNPVFIKSIRSMGYMFTDNKKEG